METQYSYIRRSVETVMKVGESIGFGNLMLIASAIWKKKLRDSGLPTDIALICSPSAVTGNEMITEEQKFFDELVNDTLSDNGSKSEE